MSGTLPNLPLSMQFDKNTAKPLNGGKLYFFAANTENPQLAYQDTGLTIAHPNPLTLDGGRVPSFYLADGSIHVRLLNSKGTVQFDERNLLVIGPSSGGGGGGGGVDATTIMGTGFESFSQFETTRAGHVRENGRTIGSASSGATERANDDTQALFLFLWPISTITLVGGVKGASAAIDWAANRQMNLPNMMGRTPKGVDGMGGTAINALTGVPFSSGSATVIGSLGGEALHTLTLGETVAHRHGAPIYDPTHVHGLANTSGTNAENGFTGGAGGGFRGNNASGVAAATNVRVWDGAGNYDVTALTGGGGAHNNEGLFVTVTWFLKL